MNEPKFKVGDKVRRTDNTFRMVKRGEVYTVRSFSSGRLGVMEDPSYEGYSPYGFELAKPSLEDVLREQYPIVYDELVSTGQFDLAPREDVYEVTIRVAKSNREDEDTIKDYLEDYVNDVDGQFLVSVKKVSD